MNEANCMREELRTLVEQWIGLWCVPVDWDLFDRLHDDAFEDGTSAGRPVDKAGFASGLRELVSAFPDLQTVVDDVVIDVDRSRAAVRWTATGTNRRRFLGVGPTNRVTTITGIEVIEIRDGRIVTRWGEWDITAHVRQDGEASDG